MQTELSIQTYLVKKAKEGDREAMNELYRLYSKAMFNICRRMLPDEDDAKDVLQDSFIDAFTKVKSLQNEVTFPAWLKRITVNNCLSVLRKSDRFADSLDENYDIPEDFESDNYLAEQKARQILEAAEKISAGCRTVFNLYLFEGYDHKEIGQILSITESASKAQYSKAKAKIRQILESEAL